MTNSLALLSVYCCEVAQGYQENFKVGRGLVGDCLTKNAANRRLNDSAYQWKAKHLGVRLVPKVCRMCSSNGCCLVNLDCSAHLKAQLGQHQQPDSVDSPLESVWRQLGFDVCRVECAAMDTNFLPNYARLSVRRSAFNDIDKTTLSTRGSLVDRL